MKRKTEKISGTFIKVVSTRGSDNIQSFTILKVTLKDGVVTDVTTSHPDTPAIVFSRADRYLRDSYQPVEEFIDAKS